MRPTTTSTTHIPQQSPCHTPHKGDLLTYHTFIIAINVAIAHVPVNASRQPVLTSRNANEKFSFIEMVARSGRDSQSVQESVSDWSRGKSKQGQRSTHGFHPQRSDQISCLLQSSAMASAIALRLIGILIFLGSASVGKRRQTKKRTNTHIIQMYACVTASPSINLDPSILFGQMYPFALHERRR